MPDTLTPAHPTVRRRPAWWQAALLAAAAAVVVDLAILALGTAADATFVIDDNGKPHEVVAGDVVFSSAVPLLVAIAVVAAIARWWAPVVRVAQVVGGGLALFSALGPLSADTDGGTALALALMHVVVGVALVAGLEAIRRGRSDAAAAAPSFEVGTPA
jgi:hypothetical protein